MIVSNSNIKPSDKFFASDKHTPNHTQNHNPYEFFTIAAIEDDLLFHLSSKCECQIDERTKVIYPRRKYLDYADKFLYRINLFRPVPKFEINQLDIPQQLEQVLVELNEEVVKCVITNVVRRILESVDPVYFHTNGIYSKVKWRIIN